MGTGAGFRMLQLASIALESGVLPEAERYAKRQEIAESIALVLKGATPEEISLIMNFLKDVGRFKDSV